MYDFAWLWGSLSRGYERYINKVIIIIIIIILFLLLLLSTRHALHFVHRRLADLYLV